MFLSKFFALFANLFNQTKKDWGKVSPVLQDAMKTASSIINIINQELNGSPTNILNTIRKNFPLLIDDKLINVLGEVGADLKIAENINSANILSTIMGIQKVLIDKKAKSETDWEKASHAGYLAISVALAPANTKIAALVAFAEFVYHVFVKSKNIVTAPVEVPPTPAQ